MRSYPLALRLRVLADCDAGMPTSEVAHKHGVSSAWIRRLKQRRRELGRIEPLPQRHGPLPKLHNCAALLRTLVQADPNITADQIRARLPIAVSRSSVLRMLRRLGLGPNRKRGRPRKRLQPPEADSPRPR
jgi:transposase